jgi:hypothetical protein
VKADACQFGEIEVWTVGAAATHLSTDLAQRSPLDRASASETTEGFVSVSSSIAYGPFCPIVA